MKKLLLLLVMAGAMYAEDNQNSQNYLPHQTVIAFDLHEVVLDRSYSKLFSAIKAFFAKSPLHHISLLNPVCGYRVYCILKKTSKTAENIYEHLTQHYPKLAMSKQEFFDMCNMYEVNPEMHQLIDDLKAQGYRVAICSNIGDEVYKDFRKKHPEFFDKFEIVGTSHPDDNYLRKPAPEFFDKFKRMCREQLGEQNLRIIFTDDRKENARAAKENGIEGICFESPAKLRSDLKNAGLNGI